MLRRGATTTVRQLTRSHSRASTSASFYAAVRAPSSVTTCKISQLPRPECSRLVQQRAFHVTSPYRAQGPTADALMENLTDLYSTAKDEFEIAAEETEKKTVYAADDREAAKEALNTLKEAYEKAVRESDPEVAKEVQSRTGPRIRELENAVTAMEEMAMED